MGFMGGILGTRSDFQAQQAQLPQLDYQNAFVNQDVGNKAQADERAMQGNLYDQLSAMAQGNGPSVAAQQQQLGLNQANQQFASALGSSKGLNPALAARMAARQNEANTQNLLGQSGLLRAQEQMGAYGAAGNVLGQMRAQDLENQQSARQYQLGLGNLANSQNQINVQNLAQAQGLNQNTANQNAQNQAGLLGAFMQSSGQFMSGMSKMWGGAHGGEAGKDFGGNNAMKEKAFLDAIAKHSELKAGGKVPGQAKVKGDSKENDTVPAMLSPGEIVIPRSIAKDPEAAKDFVQAIHDRSSKKAKSYGDVLKAKKDAGEDDERD